MNPLVVSAVLLGSCAGFAMLIAAVRTVADARVVPTGFDIPALAPVDRRATVSADPTLATYGDVRRSLVAGGVERERAFEVVTRAVERHITAVTLWLWTTEHGAESTALVVAADLSGENLLMHLLAGTTPATDEVELFAFLSGWPTTPAAAPESA
ncbi:MAG: hypothetical protein WB767_03660 [Nocardioides sp.]